MKETKSFLKLIFVFKQCDTEEWASGEPQPMPSVNSIVAMQRNLKADECYNIRFLLLISTEEYFEYQVPFTSFKTLCQGNFKK